MNDRSVLVAQLLKSIDIDSVAEKELIMLQCRVAWLRFVGLKKAGFSYQEALSLCLKSIEL